MFKSQAIRSEESRHHDVARCQPTKNLKIQFQWMLLNTIPLIYGGYTQGVGNMLSACRPKYSVHLAFMMIIKWVLIVIIQQRDHCNHHHYHRHHRRYQHKKQQNKTKQNWTWKSSNKNCMWLCAPSHKSSLTHLISLEETSSSSSSS